MLDDTPPPPERKLVSAEDDCGKLFYSSNWNTAFLPTRGDHPPYDKMDMWSEHPIVGKNASLVPDDVKSIPINPPGTQWMTRAYSQFPLWHIVDQGAPEPRRNAFSTPQRGGKDGKGPSSSRQAAPAPAIHPLPSPPSPSSNPSTPMPDPFFDAPSSQMTQGLPASQPQASSLPLDTVMSPPLAGEFDSWRSALKYAEGHAEGHGYALTIYSSKGSDNRRTIRMRCSRGGLTPEEREARQLQGLQLLDGEKDAEKDGEKDGDESKQTRARTSRMVGCPFRLIIRPKRNDLTKHVLIVENGEHAGHEMDPDIGLVKGNALAAQERELLVQWKETQPRSMPLDFLDQLNARRKVRGEALMTRQSIISNFLSRHKSDVESKQGALAVALRQLEQEGEKGPLLIYRHVDSETRLDGLFFTHKRMIDLLSHFGAVLALDATYEMCKHNIKVVQLIVLLPWGAAMPVAFGLLEEETEVMYTWLLEHLYELRAEKLKFDVIMSDNATAVRSAIRNIYPQAKTLLCHWHATENIMAKAAPGIAGDARANFRADWRKIVDTEDEREAERLWKVFEQTYEQTRTGVAAVDYVRRCWRSPQQWPSSQLATPSAFLTLASVRLA